MLCLSLLWRGLLMMATSALKTKSSLCSKWRLVQCQAPHAVPGSALGLLKTRKMLLVELNCSAVAEYIQANRTVPQSTLDLPLCRARRFSVVSARPKHTMKKNPTASTLLSCGWDKHQKKKVISASDLVSARKSQSLGASNNCWDWRESSSWQAARQVFHQPCQQTCRHHAGSQSTKYRSGEPRHTVFCPCISTLKCAVLRGFPAGLGLIQHAIPWNFNESRFGGVWSSATTQEAM